MSTAVSEKNNSEKKVKKVQPSEKYSNYDMDNKTIPFLRKKNDQKTVSLIYITYI